MFQRFICYTFAWLLAHGAELPWEEDCQEDCGLNALQMKATKDSAQWHGHCHGPPGDAWCYTKDERLCRERRCEWIVDGTTPKPAWGTSEVRGNCVQMGPQQQCSGDEMSCEMTPGCTWTGTAFSVTMAPMVGMPTMAPLQPLGGNCIGTPMDQVNCFGLPEWTCRGTAGCQWNNYWMY
mmetsp:Transcript_9469/g.15735  ORF Transcript_9469/g.15735 Transcript_9469/m.15735 type:complete len:179 (-) Transcript_9469:38-574(-)